MINDIFIRKAPLAPIKRDVLQLMKRIISIIFIFNFLLQACSFGEVTPIPSTPTFGPSPTSTITPAPTSSPTPLPTATPIPAVRISSGEKSIFEGNYSQARQEFQSALTISTDDTTRASSLLGMGKTDFLSQNFSSSLESLHTLTQNYPNTDAAIEGWFLLGESDYYLKRYQEASDAYQHYLDAKPGLLDAYIQEKRGNALSALGNYKEAQKAFLAAEIAPGQLDPEKLRISLANNYLNASDPGSALKIFDDIYATTTDDYVKAEMDLLSGRALLALGRTDDGYGRWRHAVDNYPLSYDAYSALLGLVDANQPVDEFNRGLVDFYARKYDVALRAFQNYANKNPNHDGSVLHYMAQTLREMGDYKSAVALWDRLIEKYPGNHFYDSAWDERATTQWAYLGDFSSAAKGLEQFSSQNNSSPLAPTYLFEAARIYERGGELDKAAVLWESLPDRFQADTSMGDAWFQAGIIRYRQKNYALARKDFQQAVLFAKEKADRARGLMWVGKAFATVGDMQNARSTWEQSQVSDPSGYYSLRSQELLQNRQPFTAPPTLNLNVNLAGEKEEAASWLRIKFNLPVETDLSNPGALSKDSRFQRGAEFWKLGLYDQARIEFEDLRQSVKTDPADSFRLGNYLLDIGAYRSAINALREVLTLAGLVDQNTSLTAPGYFQHVRYGLFYSDIILPAASGTGFNPLFVFSVIRQESLFESFAGSNAGARGLMQIIPDTGTSISTQMGWPVDFEPKDLFSPYINVRMGTFYLNSCRQYVNGDIYATLAAYNGGPGNASIWQSLANNDLDLELEIIRYSQTRDYIRGIYEIYSMYRSFYSPVQ